MKVNGSEVVNEVLFVCLCVRLFAHVTQISLDDLLIACLLCLYLQVIYGYCIQEKAVAVPWMQRHHTLITKRDSLLA
jgi:hypothetical protein